MPRARSAAASAAEPVDLRTLTRRFAHAGRLEAILLRPERRAAAQPVGEVRIPTNVTACTDDRDRVGLRASVGFRF